jgi:hypothetical protein
MKDISGPLLGGITIYILNLDPGYNTTKIYFLFLFGFYVALIQERSYGEFLSFTQMEEDL